MVTDETNSVAMTTTMIGERNCLRKLGIIFLLRLLECGDLSPLCDLKVDRLQSDDESPPSKITASQRSVSQATEQTKSLLLISRSSRHCKDGPLEFLRCDH